MNVLCHFLYFIEDSLTSLDAIPYDYIDTVQTYTPPALLSENTYCFLCFLLILFQFHPLIFFAFMEDKSEYYLMKYGKPMGL